MWPGYPGDLRYGAGCHWSALECSTSPSPAWSPSLLLSRTPDRVPQPGRSAHTPRRTHDQGSKYCRVKPRPPQRVWGKNSSDRIRPISQFIAGKPAFYLPLLLFQFTQVNDGVHIFQVQSKVPSKCSHITSTERQKRKLSPCSHWVVLIIQQNSNLHSKRKREDNPNGLMTWVQEPHTALG